MAPLYYRGAVAAILVCSLTDEGSFEKLNISINRFRFWNKW